MNINIINMETCAIGRLLIKLYCGMYDSAYLGT